MNKKRIYVLYTGGTLGMLPTEQGLQPAAGWLGQQLAQMPCLLTEEMPEFVVHEYQPLLDSSDITPVHWQHMAQDITEHYDAYDGFVVLHGTDTMAYSAAGLYYFLTGLSKPVIFTGSQLPLSVPDSDAPNNLRNAFYVAARADITQVAVLFDQQLIAGNRATKFDAQDKSGFISLNAEPLLSWDTPFLQLPESTVRVTKNPPVQLRPYQPRNVAVLHIYPGMNFTLLDAFFDQPWDTLILHSFGSGNVPQHPVLREALHRLRQRGVQLINCTQCPSGEVQQNYASGYWLADLGVLSAGNKSIESTIAWAHLGCPI